MKLRPAILIWGAILIAAVPAFADRFPYGGSPIESPGIGISGKGIDSSDLKLNMPLNKGIFAGPASTLALIDGFEANNTFGAWDSSSSKTLDISFPSSANAGNAWSIERDRGRDRHHDGVNGDPAPVQVPEPASFSLLLLGLAAVGFLANRRVAEAKTVQAC